MRRREFIRLLGGTLAAQAIPANAQEPVRVRTVEVLMGFANDAEAKARIEAFEKGLESEGWSLGQNLRIEYRYAEGDSARMQALAQALVELKPDCVLGQSTPVTAALMRATRTMSGSTLREQAGISVRAPSSSTTQIRHAFAGISVSP